PAAHGRDDVVGGLAGGLVDKDDAVRRHRAVVSAASQLRGDLAPQEPDQLGPPHRGPEAGGLTVAAAALGAGDGRHVDALVGGAQRYLPPALLAGAEQVANEAGHGG